MSCSHQKIDQLRETEVLHLTEAVNGLTAHLRKEESGPSVKGTREHVMGNSAKRNFC